MIPPMPSAVFYTNSAAGLVFPLQRNTAPRTHTNKRKCVCVRLSGKKIRTEKQHQQTHTHMCVRERARSLITHVCMLCTCASALGPHIQCERAVSALTKSGVHTHTATQTILSGSRIGAGVRSRRRRRRTRAHAHMCTMEMRCECERVSVRFPRIASDQVRAAGSGLAWAWACRPSVRPRRG